MSKQPVIFNIQYTRYNLPKNATKEQIAVHEEERNFFDMTGGKNIFKYITTEEKQQGNGSIFEYLQKNTGVFNDKGILYEQEIKEMQERLKRNKGNIWHGFISLSEEKSPHIDTVEKCVGLIDSTFKQFFKESGFDSENMDLMCALHLDRPTHLHIHFVFWEKEPKYIDKKGNLNYRAKGRIDKQAIDNLLGRANVFIDENKVNLYLTRKEALTQLKALMSDGWTKKKEKRIYKQLCTLAKKLPKKGRCSYDSENIKEYRKDIDKIVDMMLDYDEQSRKIDQKFHSVLSRREFFVGKDKASEIEYDYKRRQGNLVLGVAKQLQKSLYSPNYKKYNAKSSKKRRRISEKKSQAIFKRFIYSFNQSNQLLERDFSHRLQDIEEEMEIERKRKEKTKEVKD